MSTEIDVDKPLWDLNKFSGRFMYFLWVTDPRTCLTSEEELMEAKKVILELRRGQTVSLSEDEINHARKIYASAFHPDTGDLQNIFGRMSFQMPGGMAITGAMLQWYRTNTAVIFWQWVNQSFNALVNYTNRNAKSSLTTHQLLFSYISATSAALVAAVVMSRIVMCAPGMLVLPIIMESLEKNKTFRRLSFLHGPFQVVAVGCFLTVMVPTACALFPQTASLETKTMMFLEPNFYDQLKRNKNVPEQIFFNKGL